MPLEPLKSGGSQDNKTVRLLTPSSVKLLGADGGTGGISNEGGGGERRGGWGKADGVVLETHACTHEHMVEMPILLSPCTASPHTGSWQSQCC